MSRPARGLEMRQEPAELLGKVEGEVPHQAEFNGTDDRGADHGEDEDGDDDD